MLGDVSDLEGNSWQQGRPCQSQGSRAGLLSPADGEEGAARQFPSLGPPGMSCTGKLQHGPPKGASHSSRVRREQGFASEDGPLNNHPLCSCHTPGKGGQKDWVIGCTELPRVLSSGLGPHFSNSKPSIPCHTKQSSSGWQQYRLWGPILGPILGGLNQALLFNTIPKRLPCT